MVERYGQKQLRQKHVDKWAETRIEKRLDCERFGMVYPKNQTIQTDNGNEIPDIGIAQWRLDSNGIKWQTVHPYILTAVWRGFNSIYWNPTTIPSKLRQEFYNEAFQEIGYRWMEVLRGVNHWSGICTGLDKIVLDFAHDYGVGDGDKRPDGVIANSRKENKSPNTKDISLALGSDILFDNNRQKQVYNRLLEGKTYDQIASEMSLSVRTICSTVRDIADFNK
jgi:hypothetical protein